MHAPSVAPAAPLARTGPEPVPLWKRLFQSAAPGFACPHCRSNLVVGTVGDCPQCERPLEDAEGRRLRPVDVGFDKRLADLDAQCWRRTWKASAWILALTAAAYVFPPWALVSGTFFLLVQLFYVRMAIVAPYRPHFGTGRRIVTRWISRLGIMSVAIHYPYLAALPVVNLIAMPLCFGGLCGATWWYHRWHLVREHERLPVAVFEKILLWLMALFLVGSLIAAALLIWGISALMGGNTG